MSNERKIKTETVVSNTSKTEIRHVINFVFVSKLVWLHEEFTYREGKLVWIYKLEL